MKDRHCSSKGFFFIDNSNVNENSLNSLKQSKVLQI